MKAQDTDYTTPPTAVQNIVASNIGLGESYILYETNDNEFTALIKKPFSDDFREIRIYRESAYNSTWEVERTNTNQGRYTVYNEYYTFSNIGYGQTLDLPIHEQVTSYSSIILCCLIVILFTFRKVFRR